MQAPYYLLEESKLRRNLELISSVAHRADIDIILAFKAYALWKTFPIFKEYIHSTTASSLFEARMALEKFGRKAHTYSPAYTDDDFDEICECSSHITFNSLSQYQRHHEKVKGRASIGLRVNPGYSEVETLLYNPCAPGTRFGVSPSKLPQQLPADIDGFHVHCHCESGADVLERSLAVIEQKFSHWFPQLKWLNLGGGHLMTRSGYDVDLLVSLMQGLHARYPWLHIILEPGSAFAWQTGPLVSHVVDVVEDSNIKTAVLDVSFTCHMPDCLEMPYHPVVRGATHIAESTATESAPHNAYRLGGCSCLSGDWMGLWVFQRELAVGDEVVFEDMLHYTTVKTTMFNGISHPDIVLLRQDGTRDTLRRFTFNDYLQRMD